MKLSAPFSPDLQPSSEPASQPADERQTAERQTALQGSAERLPVGGLSAALERQRRQLEFENTLEAHAGALDIERLVGTLPGNRTPVGQALRRDLRKNGRYVRLSRPLGHAALTWESQFPPGPGGRGWQVARLVTALGWLERLSGVRLPVGGQQDQPLTLGPGEVTLLLPAASGGLLLAEREGQLFQFLPFPDGDWHLLASVADLQTGPVAQVDEGRLGLERLPEVWSGLSSARRRERARRLRLLALLVVVALFVLVGRLLTHSGLWLLIGPALVLTLLLAVVLERRFAQWVHQGAALNQGSRRAGAVSEILFPVPPAGVASPLGSDLHMSERPFQAAQYERLLSPETQTRLATLRTELGRARSTLSPDATDSLASDLAGLLEDRFSFPHPDRALDALLEGQMATLKARLNERLDLERQRARELAAQRLRRETVDPHF